MRAAHDSLIASILKSSNKTSRNLPNYCPKKKSDNKTSKNLLFCCPEINIVQQNRQESSKLLSGKKYRTTKSVKTFKIVVREKLSYNKIGKNLLNCCPGKIIVQQNQ